MPNLILPSRFTSQPQYPAPIDRGNPLTKGITALYTPAFGFNSPGTAGGTWSIDGTQTIEAGRAGLGLTNASTANGKISTSVDSRDFLGTNASSILVFFRKTDATNRPSVFFDAGTPAGTTTRFQAHAPWTDGTTYFDFGGLAGNNRISIAGLSYSKPTALMFAGATAGLRIVQDGILRASSSTTVTRTQESAGLKLKVNDRDQANDLTQIYLVAVFNRDVPLAECIVLTRNPWQIFQAPSRRLYVPDSGVAPTFNAGWAQQRSQVIGVGVH